MKQKDQESVLGDDPLAWMKEESSKEAIANEGSRVEVEESAPPSVNESLAVDAKGQGDQPGQEPPASSSDGSPAIQLLSNLTLASISDAHIQLLSHLENSGELVLDGSRVDIIDTAGIQLLASFCLSLRERKVSFRWLTPSSELRKIADVMDLAECLDLGAGA